jgi:hypothetical protein
VRTPCLTLEPRIGYEEFYPAKVRANSTLMRASEFKSAIWRFKGDNQGA